MLYIQMKTDFRISKLGGEGASKKKCCLKFHTSVTIKANPGAPLGGGSRGQAY